MEKKFRNVCEVIVTNDYCIGCGICAGICPAHILEMKFNEYGEYQPIETKSGCLPKCDLCLRVCPFWNQEDNEDTIAKSSFGCMPRIKHSLEAGYYSECYVGYSNINGHRMNGASGGMTTWLLETLIKNGIVDHVICVTHNPESKKLFKFSVLESVEEIRDAAQSCYYPVELAEVINYIINHDGRYAITGLPCFIKGLRLAMHQNRQLNERLAYLIGLTCGQLQSKHFAEYLCALKGGDPDNLSRIVFRIKDPNRPASDYGFRFTCSSGNAREGEIYWDSGMGEVWQNSYFTQNACLYCDDVFAETADIVLMDAWLPEYIKCYKGNNLLVVRSLKFSQLIKNGINRRELCLNAIDLQQVILSQADIIYKKRKILSNRLNRSCKLKYLPQKRVLSKNLLRLDEQIIFLLNEKIRRLGRNQYINRPDKHIGGIYTSLLTAIKQDVQQLVSIARSIKHKINLLEIHHG